MHETPEVIWQGKHLEVRRRGRWEYVTRRGVPGVVGIVAVTDDAKLLLVEQYRPPVDARVIELPAGLAGDVTGRENEKFEEAARRELREETGYEADELIRLGAGVGTAGLTDECITLFAARGLRRVSDGGGDASEDIVVHHVPLEQLMDFLEAKERSGVLIDLKIHSGVYLTEILGLRPHSL